MSNAVPNEVPKELYCPITLDLFEEPIVLPCCGQTVSRSSLLEVVKVRPSCPMCNRDIADFDIRAAPLNVAVASLVDSYRQERKINLESVCENWQAELCPVVDPVGKQTGVYRLTVRIDNSKLAITPTLLIVVCDRSGSMSGNPWDQVYNSLLHISAVAKQNKNIDVAIVLYESQAELVALREITPENRRNLFTGGGTNFAGAFEKIYEILRAQRIRNYSRAVVCFLTDGQATATTGPLVTKLREMVRDKNSWTKPITIHSIGFGGGCDKSFLEEIRQSGTEEGMFRYAEPNENFDVLSGKIMELFELIASKAGVEVKVNDVAVDLAIGVDRRGSWEKWTEESEQKELKISIPGRQDQLVPIQRVDKNIFFDWYSHCIDQMATKILSLDPKNLTAISVYEQQVRRMLGYVQNEDEKDTLEFYIGQLRDLKKGQALELGRLYDLRYSSNFRKKINTAGSRNKGRDLEIRAIVPAPIVQRITDAAHFEQPIQKYSRNNDGKNRNKLQESIMKNLCCTISEETKSLMNLDSILHVDADGNNTLHLAAYCGQDGTIRAIFEQKLPDDFIHQENSDGESAITLAIKKRGFHRTLGLLLDRGACIPEKRLKPLQRYAIENGFRITGEFLDSLSGGATYTAITVQSAATMTEAYLEFVYNRLKTDEEKIPFIEICLSKAMFPLARRILEETKAIPKKRWAYNYCWPPKPDHPETEKYLDMLKYLVALNADIVGRDNFIIRGAEKGSLAHVKYAIEERKKRGKLDIEAKNELGNTALWIACAKKYPCIVEELLNEGADPNAVNDKGNSCLYPTCQIGNGKIAEMLVRFGANVEHVNGNGDTLILIACRNGQHEVLDVLLKYVGIEFVNRVAEIDGFNALFACVEANKPECLQRIYTFGVDINQRTAKNNEILADASPLHLAAYYNCCEVAQELLGMGTKIDLNAKTNMGLTALQIAVIQGNERMVDILLAAGASKEEAVMYVSEDNPVMMEKLLDRLVIVDGSVLRSVWSFYWNNIDVMDEEGNTLLAAAVLAGDVNKVSLYSELRADPLKRNYRGISPIDYCVWMKNKRILEIIRKGDEKALPVVEKIATDPIARRLLFVESFVEEGIENLREKFKSRMFIDTDEEEKSLVDTNPGAMVKYVEKTVYGSVSAGTVRKIKIDAFSRVVGDGNTDRVLQWLILCLYMRTSLVRESEVFAEYVRLSVESLVDYSGEIFCSSEQRFEVGKEVVVKRPFSGSSLWRIVTNDMNKKTGTVNIFRGGKFLGGRNSEVVILPGRYRVLAWYHYDPICLGQPNIRSHTFKIKETDSVKSIVAVWERVN